MIRYYSDKHCLEPWGKKEINDFSGNWYILDTCIIDKFTTPAQGQLFVIEKVNGTSEMNNYYFDDGNCTYGKSLVWTLRFKEYGVCKKNNEFGYYYKVRLTKAPEKRKSDEVITIGYFQSREYSCDGKISSQDYQLLGQCYWDQKIWMPKHTKRKCDHKKNKYEIQTWTKYITSCIHEPTDIESHTIGKCEKYGVIYEC